MISQIENIGLSEYIDKVRGNTNKGADFKETLSAAINTKNEDEIKKACEEVEVYMISQIFKQMKQSTKLGEELIPKGDYEVMFEDYMIEEQAENMVKAGGMGLAKMMYESMTR